MLSIHSYFPPLAATLANFKTSLTEEEEEEVVLGDAIDFLIINKLEGAPAPASATDFAEVGSRSFKTESAAYDKSFALSR